MTSGVRVRETRVATRSPAFRPRGDSGPTSSTVPTSMPPEPVSGFCILPRVGDDVEDLAAYGVAVVPSVVLVLELPEGGGVEVERSTRMRTSSGHSSLRVSSRWAACGQDRRPVVEDSVQPGRVAGSHAEGSSVDG